MHSHILCQGFIAAGKVDEDTDLAAHVNIRADAAGALIADETAKRDLLANRRRRFRDEVRNLLAAEVARKKRIEIRRICLCNVCENLIAECAELFIARSKVRLAVQLEDDADTSVDASKDSAFRSNASGFLLCL